MSKSVSTPLKVLFAPLVKVLKQRCGSDAVWAAAAPGRVNLIGDHTDYSQGFALPMGLNLYTLIVASPRRDGSDAIRILSTQEGDAILRLGCDESPMGDWTDYLRGVLTLYQRRGVQVPALDLVVGGNLPLGAGLSSSASLELCFAALIEAITGHELPVKERALLCQQAEHEFAGVPCGILDQFAVSFAKENTAMLLDCREQSIESIELPSHVRIAIVDSGVRHALADGGYAERRAQVEEAQEVLGKSLRDTHPETLSLLSDATIKKRAQHVVTENNRVQLFVAALGKGDIATAGELMYASHESLSRDFAVSCLELDTLVDAARDAGAIGARMTGGGFGGSMVAFVAHDKAKVFEMSITERFKAAGYGEPVIRWISAASGAQAWNWT
ncbi:galactokinase [Congregibacter brevis]|uniref:Galactokinase n=1 Tax=Congregibacter brevis TaxID=3081201 RepID=A0ABZ0I7F3_9GAMM|nr:galactokinase [Congregibacter sp. IMCC45268]